MTILGTTKYNLILYNIVIFNSTEATRAVYKKCLLKSLHNNLPKSYNNIFRYTNKFMNTDLLCLLLSFIITLKIFYLYLL